MRDAFNGCRQPQAFYRVTDAPCSQYLWRQGIQEQQRADRGGKGGDLFADEGLNPARRDSDAE